MGGLDRAMAWSLGCEAKNSHQIVRLESTKSEFLAMDFAPDGGHLCNRADSGLSFRTFLQFRRASGFVRWIRSELSAVCLPTHRTPSLVVA